MSRTRHLPACGDLAKIQDPATAGASSRATDLDGVDVAVPDALLLPLIEVAADTLRELEAGDVPASLRPLHGFDRRGAPRRARRRASCGGRS